MTRLSLAGRRARWLALLASSALVCALLLPNSALAHGIVAKTDLPIPTWLFAWGAAVVLIISFVALATLWPRPRLEPMRTRVLLRYPRWLDPLCGAIGLALFAIVVYSGIAGEQTSDTENLAPTFIYVLFWVGLPLASLLLGDVFRAFNPWRAFARLVAWVARLGRGERGLPAPLPYPDRLGRWPATLGILGFAWLELVYSRVDPRPQTLTFFALGYVAAQLIGMSLFGIEKWTERGDAFSVYFNLFSRISPLQWRRDRLEARRFLSGAPALAPLAGTVMLLATMIGSTSFDGFEQNSTWLNSVEPHLQSFWSNLGFGATASIQLAADVGLLATIGIVAGMYRLGIAGMRTIDEHHSAAELSRRFVHTLVPISLAYVIAHYWSLLAYQGQATAYLASNPLGDGSNIFGTANASINYSLLTPNSIWYVQVGALVLGHACGLALAHDKALIVYRRTRDAVRSQYWMLSVMVAFTCLGLWILST